MNYSLGNMLSRGGALNPDGLSLDLAFAADKTLTARKGPTPTFSRASGATEIGSDGLIRYAPENLIPYSEDFSNIAWIKERASVATNTTVAPNGSSTADKLTEDTTPSSSHRALQQISLTANTYTFSVFVKSAERSWIRIGLFDGTNRQVWFDTTNGVIGTQSNATGQIVSFGNGWWRCSVTATVITATVQCIAAIATADNISTYTGDGTSGIFLWGAQLERHTSARTYIPTTSAAVYGARFDHDPVTLASRGLLIEEARTNFVLNSDLYLTSTPTNITATTIAGTSVTGSSQIRQLSLTSSGAFTGVQSNLTGTGTGAKTLSVFIQKPTSNAAPYFTIGFASSPTQYGGIQVTMSGSVPVVSVTSAPASGFSVASSSIEAFPNNWYRVSVIVNGTASSCFPTFYPSNAIWDGVSDIRQTLTAIGTNLINVFGAQVEAGSFPTSYIPTTTASVVRSADVCSITGGDFALVYNQAELSIYSEVSYPSATVGFPVVSFNNSTSAERVELSAFVSPLRLGCFIVQNGVTQAAPNITAAANQFHKAAIYAKLNSFQIALNGVLGTKDTTGVMPTATRLNIGKQFNEVYLNGHLKRVSIYKKALSDTKLQSLTT